MWASKLNKLSSNPFFTIYYEITWLSKPIFLHVSDEGNTLQGCYEH